MRYLKYSAIAFLVLLLVFAIFQGAKEAFFPVYISSQEIEDTFFIDMPYDQVRKILVRTDALDEIIRRQHGRIVYRKWNNLNFSVKKLFDPYVNSKWKINGSGEIVIKSKNENLHNHILRFIYLVQIDANQMVIDSTLDGDYDDLMNYGTYMRFEKWGEKTKVYIYIHIRYAKRVPQGYEHCVDEGVHHDIESSLHNIKHALLDICSRYRNQRMIIPLIRNKQR